VQLSALFPLTPGNVGITEWSWAALAVVYPEIEASALAAFALSLRLSSALANWIVLVFAFLFRPRGAFRPDRVPQKDCPRQQP
jgi:uncharacterized membrane protein YbhN (UPF0104 family)